MAAYLAPNVFIRLLKVDNVLTFTVSMAFFFPFFFVLFSSLYFFFNEMDEEKKMYLLFSPHSLVIFFLSFAVNNILFVIRVCIRMTN